MLFGVELEFSVLGADGLPALGSAPALAAIASRAGLAAVPEFGSFQIELNPGPWPLTDAGRDIGMAQLRAEVSALRRFAEEHGLELSPAGLVPAVTREILNDGMFFTALNRYSAASRGHFRDSRASVTLVGGSTLEFPSETAVACINELHIHVQLRDDASTIRLFNRLNAGGLALARRFLRPLCVNGRALAPGHSTMTLFEQTYGEFNTSGTVKRVGFLPRPIASHEDYMRIVESFTAIPAETGYLPLESTVYFWVRLRGEPGSLRIEYRPPEMSESWELTIREFLACVDEFGEQP